MQTINTRDPRIGMVAARHEHLERIESYGINRVELVILPREDEPAVRAHLARVRPALSVHCPLFRDCGLDGYPLLASLFDTDLDRQAVSLQLMEREIRQAAEWGATHMVVHLQRSIGILGEQCPGLWTERQALEGAIRAGERLAVAAESAGVNLHIENMMSHPLLYRPESYLALLEALPQDRVQLCFDVGHAALDAAKFGFDLLSFADLLAPRIGSLHVYNNQIAGEFDFETLRESGRLQKHPVHPSHTVDEGWIDVAGVLARVLSRNPNALVTFEVYFALDTDREQTRAGVDWLTGFCARYWSL
jgi:sugar phosphate isomerase/epimerase